MNIPQIGTRVRYVSHGNLCAGIVAESARSPLTGQWRYRVVDFWQEISDEGAGKWISHHDLVSGEQTCKS